MACEIIHIIYLVNTHIYMTAGEPPNNGHNGDSHVVHCREKLSKVNICQGETKFNERLKS